VQLEFRGTQLSSDGGLLVMRELDDALRLSGLASAALRDNRAGKNIVHRIDRLFRQSVYGRLAGYEDVKDADRHAVDAVIHSYSAAAGARGMTYAQHGELTAVISMASQTNALATALQVEPDDRFCV
jgi:hypothetical protein